MPNLILASSSSYRKSLLERLHIPFQCVSPDLDEKALENESAEHPAIRLAREKAQAIAKAFPEAAVIGSDQVAELCFDDSCNIKARALGKPGNYQRAVEQLSDQSGQLVKFYTAVTVIKEGLVSSALDITQVQFRHLTSAEIDAYLKADRPYNCAGSFKAESLGISLFKSVKSDDPTGLIGLPLIKLSQILRELNISAN